MEEQAKANILIVEDERIVAMDIAASLRSLGYKVLGMVSSADEAIESALSTKPDLILMDIRLKGEKDGINAAEQIHQSFDVPIIYLTAYADEHTLQRAKLTEPYGYLLKPYEKRVLHSTIEMALYKKLIENKLKESERWLSTILKSIGEAIIAVDISGNIQFMNAVAEKLTGWTQDSALKNNIKDIFNIKRNDSEEQLTNFLSDEKQFSLEEAIITNRQNNQIPIEYSFFPIQDDNKNLKGTVLIFRDISEQRKAELEKEKLFNRVRDTQERLRALSRRLMEVQEREARNLARELHDEIGQVLTAIKINLQTIFRYPHTQEVDYHVKESVELVDTVLKQIRNISLDLRPSMLDDLGLVPAIRWYVDKQSQRSGIESKINNHEFSKRLNNNIEITCFRIVQEAFTNVIKHSGASSILIDLWEEDEKLHLVIQDDGKGFNVYGALKKALRGESIGILGMQERIELIGGELKIDSSEGAGTKITATFPLKEF
ncbi:MAG TPA: response regulator [Ignavibacteriaceae bacterium]|nr:response regulator [Ignavibacteriaceae bacterium]